jgi:two-component system, LytTR family, sensor histidine kinase AlgZ
MIRLLRKRHLLRFKGWGIFFQIFSITVLFSLISGLSFYKNFDSKLPLGLVAFVIFGCLVTLCSFVPLRLLYRPIQKLHLLTATLVTLSIASISSFVVVRLAAEFVPALPSVLATTPWPPENPTSTALFVALMVTIGYCLILQIAVNSRRERMARRKNISNRMKALQGRIRPHFFFNTLNSVASLIRSDPDSAEKAIEDLADVFRVVIKSDRKLVSLAEEVEISKQYMNIEKLRLGERLEVAWHLTEDALNASIPSLTLQPLLENAVYHGIEPALEGGTITIDCNCEEERLHILISNPVSAMPSTRESGNKIALKNIKERLKRQFGGDVRINIRNTLERFNVAIDTPYITIRSTY